MGKMKIIAKYCFTSLFEISVSTKRGIEKIFYTLKFCDANY